MPLGGYKGYGLGMLVEILCSVISGGAHREEVAGIHVRGRKSRASQMFIAIDVARFMPVEEFRARLEHLIAYMKSSLPAPGFDEVLVAGDPEWRMEEARLRGGIPLGQGTWTKLADVAARLGVAVPDVSRHHAGVAARQPPCGTVDSDTWRGLSGSRRLRSRRISRKRNGASKRKGCGRSAKAAARSSGRRTWRPTGTSARSAAPTPASTPSRA